MSSKSIKHRLSAYSSQACRCFYCGFPIWERNKEAFARAQNFTIAQSRQFKSTAEHLYAKADGGKDTRSNIVAACLRCNLGRHRRKKILAPEDFQKFVRKRISKKRWHAIFPRKPYVEIIIT